MYGFEVGGSGGIFARERVGFMENRRKRGQLTKRRFLYAKPLGSIDSETPNRRPMVLEYQSLLTWVKPARRSEGMLDSSR